ncbi:bifunctional 3-(3-hydroxy-phenyl)propionate/3-hydroxycinnamic acid hydroxylase [Acinetobacter sp. S40]|uniref:bifunctional 3-(3-hydroxy-phenyl)propionate/3-hydroxycinnamic acid hydroxylase n=1 Tax=Acinetobacter sp. S40 TaxID=2767434 RepID=UPI00190B641C|nr:bifunctional 3-(3-hydroxy-phenyl)propionate/3-hydroxycinnamic acid hydroxylase [Acinetobacter sp. S40]MBJ9984781.1 bifunctional 3-(3-hydroxy-phenyl)propionate/3-hydroxycinnamic acid hydroxylase [Acinetobacter sp. S40]
MNKNPTKTDFDVIQIGYGPVSKVSALLLEKLGWSVGIFERWGEVYPLPRAVCIDHEIYRMLHAAGLGKIVNQVTQPAPAYRWFNKDWKELLKIDWPQGSVSGTCEVRFIHQPSFEKELDLEVRNRNQIHVYFEHECIQIQQFSDHVLVEVKDIISGETKTYSAKYLLGVDGANSLVRESQNISRTDLGFEADWLVVDYTLNENLTAKDLGLVECGQYCNPERPTTIVPGGTIDGRENRRWEFMRLPHETREEMLQEDKVHALLGNWIKPEQGHLVRHALYTFRSLITDIWVNERIILAGDAAHVMPPFMGQGMCAGLRDVWNLSWKLHKVLSHQAAPEFLKTYELERKPHVTEVIKLSMFLGSIICMPDQDQAQKRDAAFLSDHPPQLQPFPHLTSGLLAQDDQGKPLYGAGMLSPHGMVRFQRRTGRLDRFTDCNKFKLLIDQSIDLTGFDAYLTSLIQQLDIQIIPVAPKEHALDHQFTDTQGQILSFMNSLSVHALLVRPDHYVFGTAKNKQELSCILSQLKEQIAQFDCQLELIA